MVFSRIGGFVSQSHRFTYGVRRFIPSKTVSYCRSLDHVVHNTAIISTCKRRLSSQQQQQQQHEQVEESFRVAQINYTTGNVEYIYLPPTEILERTCILPRDLVSLDLASSTTAVTAQRKRRHGNSLTAILPRTDSILLSFGNVRAVAGRDHVYIMEAHTKVAQNFAKELQEVLSTANTKSKSPTLLLLQDDEDDPPELVFLEFVLKDTVETYMRRIQLLEPIVDDFLSRVSTTQVFTEEGVHQLVPLKDTLQRFELRVKQSLDCLKELLNDDDEMLKLLLTEQAEARESGVPVHHDRHQAVELLVGIYARQLANLLQEVDYLLGRVQSKQEFVTLALAAYRNRLVRMNVNIGIVGVSTAITTTIAGLFGMNLVSGLEDSSVAFVAVAGGSTVLSMAVAAQFYHFMSGRVMQQQAAKSLQANKTLTKALSDMVALDYAFKKMMLYNATFNKTEFQKVLSEARLSQKVTTEEIDLLFEILDTTKDDHLSLEDFHPSSTTNSK